MSLDRTIKLSTLYFKGPRAQIDRMLYKKHIQEEVETTANLAIEVSPVEDLILKTATHPSHDLMKQECCGVKLGNDNIVQMNQ